MSGDDPTKHLRALGGDDRDAASKLLPLLYGELRRLAEQRLARLPPGQTLQATALVHEAFLRLVGDEDPGWQGRAHFFGAAARAMRDILVEQARRKSRIKHGGDRGRVEFDEQTPDLTHDTFFPNGKADEIVSLDAALRRMERQHPRAAEVVMYRYFAGLDSEQAATLLGVSARTIERDWRFARAWLRNEIDAETVR